MTRPSLSAWRQIAPLYLALLVVPPAIARPALPDPGSASPLEKEVLGYLERVIIWPGKLELEAKLDTGADTSSLDAADIRRIRRGEKRLVRFSVIDPETREPLAYERPLVRMARIKRHDGRHQRRPVVALELCIGDRLKKVEVSLIDRSEFSYPFLLGRSALEGIALVDSELTFTTPPRCDREAEKGVG